MITAETIIDGDFASEEVTRLRDEADIIVTNPPFSLFRKFLAWIMEGQKQFLILGNKNAVTYKEVFPLIKDDRMWLGVSQANEFDTPDGKSKKVQGLVRWFTNLDHMWRHKQLNYVPIDILTATGVTFSRYDNYDAIDVPKCVLIPADYDGVMGVPITFLDAYNPDQFEILGASQRGCHDTFMDTVKYDAYKEYTQKGTQTGSSGTKTNENANLVGKPATGNYFMNDSGKCVYSAYQRLFIKWR